MLKILSPLVRTEEAEPLVTAGADEFYCGLISPAGALNDRPNNDQNNFSNIVQLQKAVKTVRKFRKKIYLTINNPTLDLEAAIQQAKVAEYIGMDGLILSNLLLIKKLQDMNLKLELNGSCLGAVFNSQSVLFFQRLGIKTFHVPRQLGLEHIRMIRQMLPEVRLSVFGMRGMCVNVEAFCLLHHLKAEYFVPCQHFKTVRILGSRTLSKDTLNKKINMPEYSCALCALRQLNAMGVYSIKIEGRNGSARSKLNYVSIMKSARDYLKSCDNDDDYGKLCKKLFQRYFNEACQAEYCYF